MRGRDLPGLPPRVALGVRTHRAVDAATDAHPAVAALRAGFRPELRRFAGIAIDVGLDHRIARDWPAAAVLAGGRVPPAPDVGAHATRVERALREALRDAGPALPVSLARFAPHLVAAMPTWSTRAGVAATLERLSRRSPRFAPLADAAGELERLDAELGSVLDALWPALVERARDMLDPHDPEARGR